ncbi:hypothetical protein [Thiothrix eikelboomii]|uniref:Uncharacterized protein n=1 Tax=Thiothrix eikelboomii TaxID=92487 RepID=A0A1T4XA41_9GAMM|nr:hypothetical protein [Thiothrix eikelboomii]SKA85968.1 hypothetical protein SAMN02745130_02659 [Thiothrix eikelboomii]
MTFSINAWLDRADPFIELRNTKTGELMALFTGEQLIRCLEQGDVCLSELCQADQSTQQELVRCLLLAHCSNCLQQHTETVFKKYLHRREQGKRLANNKVLP